MNTFVAKLEVISFSIRIKLRIMKIRNVVLVLALAVVTLSSSVVYSQNENNSSDLSVANEQTALVGGGDVTKISEVHGVYVPD